MPEAFNEISPAISCGAFAVIVAERRLAQEQDFPPIDDRPEIEGEGELVRRNCVVNRRLVDQERIKGVDIVAGGFGEMVVRKSRIKLTAFSINTFMHGAMECFF